MVRANALAAVCMMVAAPLVTADMPVVRRVSLSDTHEALTPEGRERLEYLIGCALPEGLVVETDVKGVHYEFPGRLGLAPGWRERAMTAAEARWVSACILARTNAFGVTVQISLRADQAPVEALDTSTEERAQFPLHEAGFFGNIFSEDAPAYVCTGGSGAVRAGQLEALRRVCSLPADPADRPGLTRCNFVLAGACDDMPFTQGDVDYSGEVIHVFLRNP
jgi:hypothetical protein